VREGVSECWWWSSGGVEIGLSKGRSGAVRCRSRCAGQSRPKAGQTGRGVPASVNCIIGESRSVGGAVRAEGGERGGEE